MSRVTRLLVAAKVLIAKPEHWVKHYPAAQTPYGTAFCAMGAVGEVCRANLQSGGKMGTMLELLRGALPVPYRGIASFNDDPKTKHEDVLALFDRAIERSKG